MKRLVLFIVLLFLLFPTYSFDNSTNQSIIQKIESGIEIFSIDNGKLIDKGYNLEDGNFIEIEYYQIGIIIRYCHLSKFKYFFDGNIEKGNVIGITGETGSVVEPCLELKIRITESFINLNK